MSSMKIRLDRLEVDASETAIRCECGLPAARLEHGCLVITSRHRGEHHQTAISLHLVRQWLERLTDAESLKTEVTSAQ